MKAVVDLTLDEAVVKEELPVFFAGVLGAKAAATPLACIGNISRGTSKEIKKDGSLWSKRLGVGVPR